MWLFGNKTDINSGVEEYRNTPGAVLLDVREANDTPLFVYCLRGSRSKKAAGILKSKGYENVKSIGGIKDYKNN